MDEDREEYGVVTAVGALVPVAVAAMLVLLRDHVLSNLALGLMAVVVLVAAAGVERREHSRCSRPHCHMTSSSRSPTSR